ncbi:MAG: DoxX family protein [Myxococcales bacterium]|nr:DoxX family protein [Myxococcales bacterium]
MKKIWIGRILSAVPVALLVLSGVLKLARGPDVVDAFTHRFGFPASLIVPIGIIELLCTILYVIPQTAVLGAILVTGYFGGAIATEVRAGGSNWVGPLVFGILAWLGLYLREERLNPVLPLRATGSPSATPRRAS